MSDPSSSTPSDYGDSFADVYDEWYADITDAEATADRIAALVAEAGGGPVLELGVGSGRLALPIAERGIDVVGVDSSPAMLDLLASKPGADRISALRGDMATVDQVAPGPFAVVLAGFNTFFNLDAPEHQVRCMEGIARVLAPGGSLVIEAFVPAERAGGVERDLSTARVDHDRVVLTATEHDPDGQTVVGQHIDITAAGVRLRPWRIRYLTPGQLDDLAARAGMHLVERHAGWSGEPFDGDSPVHVSRYGLRG